MPKQTPLRSVRPFVFQQVVQQCLDTLFIAVPIFWFLGMISIPTNTVLEKVIISVKQLLTSTISFENNFYINSTISSFNSNSPVDLDRISYFVLPFVLAPLILVYLLIVNLFYALIIWLVFKIVRIRSSATFVFSFTLGILALTWFYIVRHGLTHILLQHTYREVAFISGSSPEWITHSLTILYSLAGEAVFVTLTAIIFYFVWVKESLKKPNISETNPQLVTQLDSAGFSRAKTKWQKK